MLLINFLENIFYNKIFRKVIYLSRIGRKSMFGYANSGINFDYIYRNCPSGYTKLGKVVDKVLLNLPAAKATRARKEKITSFLREIIEDNKKNKEVTKIVDLASGPARYIIDAIDDSNREWVQVLCFDIDRRSLTYGKQLKQNRPICYKRANIFELGYYKKLSKKKTWKPNLVLASGLYEYLDEKNAKFLLHEIVDNLDKDGVILIITQKDNPNKKLLEKLGKTRSGEKWKLFYREPSNIKDWMRKAGLKDISVEIDKWGMYIFCIGRK